MVPNLSRITEGQVTWGVYGAYLLVLIQRKRSNVFRCAINAILFLVFYRTSVNGKGASMFGKPHQIRDPSCTCCSNRGLVECRLNQVVVFVLPVRYE